MHRLLTLASSVKSSRDANQIRAFLIWGSLLLIWLISLCVVHDPRPLGASEWAVGEVCSVTGISEITSRVVVTFVLRGVGMAMIGALLASPHTVGYASLPCHRTATCHTYPVGQLWTLPNSARA
jgi:hypothetical protein